MTEWFAICDGGARTVLLLAGPTADKEAAAAALEDAPIGEPARVVDRGTLDMLTLVSGYDLDDRRTDP